jgi:hypothetical protein
MPKPTLRSAMLAVALGALLTGTVDLRAEDAPARSPYESGPPPVTDGYTDTSQGGTKGSGDAPIPPESKDGKVVTYQGHPEPVPTPAK